MHVIEMQELKYRNRDVFPNVNIDMSMIDR